MKALVALLILITAAGAAPPEEPTIPLIGEDETGAPVQVVVTRRGYAQRLTRLVTATQESSLPALARVPRRPGWALRTVVVGVGLSLTAGLGPIFEVNATPRFRLAFTNGEDVVLP